VLEFPSLLPLEDVSVEMYGCRSSNLPPDSLCENFKSLGETFSDSEGVFVSNDEVHSVYLDKDGYEEIDYINRENPEEIVCYMGKIGWVRVKFVPLVPDGQYLQASVQFSQKVPVDAADKDSTEVGRTSWSDASYTSLAKPFSFLTANVPVKIVAYFKKGNEPTRDTTFYVPCFANDTNVVELRY
jgi:hypothetical protein